MLYQCAETLNIQYFLYMYIDRYSIHRYAIVYEF